MKIYRITFKQWVMAVFPEWSLMPVGPKHVLAGSALAAVDLIRRDYAKVEITEIELLLKVDIT